MIELIGKKEIMELLKGHPDLIEKAERLTVYELDEITEEDLAIKAQSGPYDVDTALKEIDRIFTHAGKNLFERTKKSDSEINTGNRKSQTGIGVPGRK